MYHSFLSPLLDRLDSETMHGLSVSALSAAERFTLTRSLVGRVGTGGKRVVSERLQMNVGGIAFENPVVVGAGWDKHAECVVALHTLGFSAVEVGTITEHPQPGNPKPRQWIISNGVAINCLGFNCPGMEVVAEHLARYGKLSFPLGVNVGKNKEVPNEDAARAYAAVIKRLYSFASYFAVNVSSPNTPGLRALQDKSILREIVQAVREAQREKGGEKPTFVKIAPELTFEAIDDVIDVVKSENLAGIIATNTTSNPEIKGKYGTRWRNQMGGLSGNDAQFRALSTERIAHIHQVTNGELDIIGIGGVHDGATALEKIRAGAKLVQVVTGIRGEGPQVATKINREILSWLESNGVRNLSEIVGVDSRALKAQGA